MISHSKISRRTLIQLLGAAGITAPLISHANENPSRNPRWLSATGAYKAQYGISWSNQDTNLNNLYTGFRMHDVAAHPLRPNHALVFGRRPAMQAIEVDLNNGAITQTLKCSPNQHLFGHGCFSKNGKHLFTTEGNIKSGAGTIVVRDSQNYQQLAQYSSGGIGPHQIKLMPDGNTLAVANGGILTHPNSGRKKLNLSTMDSCLSYIDSQTGQRLNNFRIEEKKASIRHLDIHPDGTVALAMQVQREACNHSNVVPLAAIHKPQAAALTPLEQPQTLITQMQDYIGSVAIHPELRIAGFTSPRGNLAAFWSIDDGRFMGYHRLHDACGIAISPDQKHFLLSSSTGQIRFITANNLTEDKNKRQHYPDTQWDNHLLII